MWFIWASCLFYCRCYFLWACQGPRGANKLGYYCSFFLCHYIPSACLWPNLEPLPNVLSWIFSVLIRLGGTVGKCILVYIKHVCQEKTKQKKPSSKQSKPSVESCKQKPVLSQSSKWQVVLELRSHSTHMWVLHISGHCIFFGHINYRYLYSTCSALHRAGSIIV